LNEAAVGLALWAEYLGTLAATAIAVSDPVWQDAPVESGSGCVWAGIGVGRSPDVIGRAVIDG
jgi:DNA-binding protein H-NS